MDIITFAKFFRGSPVLIEIHGHDDGVPIEDWEGTNLDLYKLPEDHIFHRLKVDRVAIKRRSGGVLQIYTRTSGAAR